MILSNKSAADKSASNLKLYFVDILSAGLSALVVSPFIAIVDQCKLKYY